MTAVKAVKVLDVEEEFRRRSVVSEADEKKAKEAKRRAFDRALEHLDPIRFCTGMHDGQGWIWKL